MNSELAMTVEGQQPAPPPPPQQQQLLQQILPGLMAPAPEELVEGQQLAPPPPPQQQQPALALPAAKLEHKRAKIDLAELEKLQVCMHQVRRHTEEAYKQSLIDENPDDRMIIIVDWKMKLMGVQPPSSLRDQHWQNNDDCEADLYF